MLSLRELPIADRPRERLLREGAHTLDSHELLALVLGTGRGSGEDALELGAKVLAELGGVESLAAADISRLRQIGGIGPVKAARIQAAFELCLRAGPVTFMDPEPDPDDELLEQIRGLIPAGEQAVLAIRPAVDTGPLILSPGRCLSADTPPGSLLAQMLTEGAGGWWVISLRPQGPIQADEKKAASTLQSAAILVDVAIERVVLFAGMSSHVLSA